MRNCIFVTGTIVTPPSLISCPLTMTAAPVLLIVVALLACHIPVRRAMNVDAVIALRQD
jgi:hypothetical protein